MIIWKCREVCCESLKAVRLASVVRQWGMAAVRLCCSSWLVLDYLGFFFLNVQTPWSPDFLAACCILLGPAQGAGIISGKLPFVKSSQDELASGCGLHWILCGVCSKYHLLCCFWNWQSTGKISFSRSHNPDSSFWLCSKLCNCCRS